MVLYMELSLKAMYGIRLIQELSKSQQCISGAELSRKLGISPEYVASVARFLIEGGIVESLKGPGGGYALTRPISKITLADVIDAIPPGICRKLPQETQAMTGVRSSVRRIVLAALSAKGVAEA